MNQPEPQRFIDLIDDLIQRTETPWIEFKHNNSDPDRIGMLASAISNAARIAGQTSGYVVWGVKDGAHDIVGTSFEPCAQRVGSQEFSLWLAKMLSPSIAFQFHTIEHPRGRVVLMEIPAATAAPVTFKNIPYCRIGSATPKLTEYPDRYQALVSALRPFTW